MFCLSVYSIHINTRVQLASQAGGVLDPKAQLASADGKGSQAAMNKALELSQLNKGTGSKQNNRKKNKDKGKEDAKAPPPPPLHVVVHPARARAMCFHGGQEVKPNEPIEDAKALQHVVLKDCNTCRLLGSHLLVVSCVLMYV